MASFFVVSLSDRLGGSFKVEFRKFLEVFCAEFLYYFYGLFAHFGTGALAELKPALG